MKNYLSIAAAVAALALTTATGFAQTAGNKTNSVVPGSPGYSGSSPKGLTNKKAISKKQYTALNGGTNSSNSANARVPGAPGYSGSSKPAGAHGTQTSGATLNSMAINRKNKNANTPNSQVPGSDSYSGSAPAPKSGN